MKSMHVKPDYLIGLASERYRVDTNAARIARICTRAAVQRVGRRRSSAKSDSDVSRARTSSAAPRSTSTSHGRGREF
jgi:hypothetical protein